MLRPLAVVLVLANLGVWAWSHGWLAGPPFGLDPDADREPQRLQHQLRADAFRPLPLATLASAAASAPAPAPLCLEAGPFGKAERSQLVQIARAGLPEGSWTLEEREGAGSWLIYMGRFPTRDAMLAKTEQLQRLGVRYEEIKFFPGLEPGLVLGRYTHENDAKDALKTFVNEHRIRTARIVTVTPATISLTLRIPQADAALQAGALALREQLGGKAFVICARPPDAAEAAAAAASAASTPAATDAASAAPAASQP